jgi:hypothetical protein
MSEIFVKAGDGRMVPFPDGRKLPGDPSALADGSIGVDPTDLFVQRCLAVGDLIAVTETTQPTDTGYTSGNED